MDALLQIIQTFSKSDVSEFTSFINRQKHKKNRKDLELFWLFQKEGALKQEEVLMRLYPDGNRVAYHALRKKLIKHLCDYIFFKQLREDDTAETQIAAYISLARYLMDYGIISSAWKYLKKAEQMAVNAELFSLANQILRIQLEMPLRELNQEIDQLIDKKEKYFKLAIEDDRADTAYKIIQYYLKTSKTQFDGPDMHMVIKKTLSDYELNKALSRRPSMVYKLMSIARSAAKLGKDYYSFEPLLLSYYTKMELSHQPKARDKVYVARLQYMIAHTLFRNKKFAQSLDYLLILREQLRGIVRTEYVKLLPRFTQLFCATRFFTGHIDEAIRIADATFMEKLKLQPEDVLNLKLNQAIYHFFNRDFKVAARILISIGHSNTWCTKVAGVEWVIKKDLLEIFIQFELGHLDIASNKVRSILRQKDRFVTLPQFERVMVFLKLVKLVIDDPSVAETADFDRAVEQGFDWIPIEREDLHASVYYAWLKSKIVKADAYTVLLDLISIEH